MKIAIGASEQIWLRRSSPPSEDIEGAELHLVVMLA
jgi:hypothetical protein